MALSRSAGLSEQGPAAGAAPTAVPELSCTQGGESLEGSL